MGVLQCAAGHRRALDVGGGNEVSDDQLERGSRGGIIGLELRSTMKAFFSYEVADDISNRVVSFFFPSFMIFFQYEILPIEWVVTCRVIYPANTVVNLSLT